MDKFEETEMMRNRKYRKNNLYGQLIHHIFQPIKNCG